MIMCQTKVINVHTNNSYQVYIGRGSKWGNPYSHKKGTKATYIVNSRNDAIIAYRRYITRGDGKHLLKDLYELKGKVLGCYCHPLPCHGDILAELANQLK